jgi:hypothetical protein
VGCSSNSPGAVDLRLGEPLAADRGEVGRGDQGKDGPSSDQPRDAPVSSIFPVKADRSQIVLVQASTVPFAGGSYRVAFYRNLAYRCGKQGRFTFLVVENVQHTGQKRPLWVLMHGGGVGYYQKGGTYVGGESQNLEEDAAKLLGVIQQHTAAAGTFKKTIAGGRLEAGYRFLAPSMCDHDLYAGLGNHYPHNPNWPAAPDTVDGLLATMAAIEFVARGNGALGGYPTGPVFLHGTSAGSAGAYVVTHAFERSGVKLTGAILDAYLISTRVESLFGTGCTPQEKGAAAQGTTFSFAEVVAKVGPFVADPALFAESTVGTTHHVPLFDIVGQGDPHCCGDAPPVAAAKAAGIDNNCRFVHGLLGAAMAKQPASASFAQLVVAANEHVVTPDEGAHQAALQTWLDAILATNPPSPWP